MATFDPYNEQIMGLREQQALAQKLRDQGLEMPQGQMVSGHFVAPATTQYLAQALKGYLGGQDVEAAKQGIKDLMAQRLGERQKWMESAPQEQTVQVEDRSSLPEKQQTQMGPSPYSKALRVKPTIEDTLAWYTKMPGADEATIGQGVLKAAELSEAQKARQDALRAQMFQQSAEKERDRELRRDMAAMAQANRPEPLVAVLDKEGKPVMLPRSQAGGMTPANAQTMGQSSPEQRIRDANDAMSILRQAAPLVNKSTSSGVGTAADYLAGLAGYSTAGADTAADLKVLGGALVSKMPKMSGPQSDKDVALYKEMAGKLGDSTVPASQKRSAMQTLMNLQAKYAGVAPETLNFEGSAKSANDILMQADKIIGGGQ
jgi:hypothetical protein